MKKNLGLLFLVIITIFSSSYSVENIESKNQKDYAYNTQVKNPTNIIRLSDDKKSKKDLKAELKRREKYHRTLLGTYNENFSPEYLDLIEKNSRQLQVLRELYKGT